MRDEVKDITGQTLQIGDKIVAAYGYETSGLLMGEIVNFTPKSVKIRMYNRHKKELYPDTSGSYSHRSHRFVSKNVNNICEAVKIQSFNMGKLETLNEICNL